MAGFRLVMTWPALIGAGLVAGFSGAVTGVGSVFSYPVLLALGLPATSANVTNTVGLALGGIGGAYSSRPELVGLTRRLISLAVAGAVGTVVGSALLLLSPPRVFEIVVPFLVAAASISILLPRPERHATGGSDGRRRVVAANVGVAAVSVYNGYFAAGGGVLIIAALLVTTSLSLNVANSIKNLLGYVSDVAAALAFAIFGPVDWASVPPLAIGLLAGSWLGPPVARRLPVTRLRALIAALGLGLALALAINTF